MQAAQYALSGAGVIVLHKSYLLADGRFKLGLVKALVEKTAVVAEHIGLKQNNFRDS